MPGDSIADPMALWEWMDLYASFQFAAQEVVDASRHQAHVHNIDHKCFEAGLRTWELLKSAAPVDDLEWCYTTGGATWQPVVHCLDRFFESRGTCKLMLGGWPVTFIQLLGIISQLIKQLLTWYLTNCDDEKMNDCVSALVCFNCASKSLGARARCHLKYDSDGVAHGVVFRTTGHKPENKYTRRTRPTKTQMNTGVLQSQQRRSDNIVLRIGKKVKRYQVY